MAVIDGWNDDNIKVGGGEFTKLPPGIYVCKITEINHRADKNDYEIFFDIAEGEFEGYYSDEWGQNNKWSHRFYQSYSKKQTKKGGEWIPLKSFVIGSVEPSNPGFKWDGDTENSKALIGKLFGAAVGEAEYEDNRGGVGTKIDWFNAIFSTAEKARNKEMTIPGKKLLESSIPSIPATPIDDDDMPFAL